MISKIFHLADFHNRNLKRHREYRTVFERTFQIIEQQKDEHSVIVISGDVVHSKTEMSPELIELTGYILKRFADLCTTIVIPGNHDCNLNNLYRQDALTPIISSLQLSNLHYLKHSEVFVHDEVAFSHYSILDDKSKWISADQIKEKYKIALFHGPVSSASTEVGYIVTTGKADVKDFNGYDLVLLGDIHKRQSLQAYNRKKNHPAVEYPGSLIQQNHGEEIDKGFLVWDTQARTSTYISVPNDHAYFTLVAKDNKLQNKVPTHIKELTLRVKYENCDKVYLQQLQARYKLRYNLGEILLQPQSKFQFQNLNHSIEDLCDVRDVEKQNVLIESFVASSLSDESEKIDINILFDINREVNGILKSQTSSIRNVIWRPLKFTFSNMFSYGPNNEIDFSDYNGVYGVFAPNASGKSTLLDAFMFCIFDKCSKTSRALHVLNNKSKDFKSCLQFESGGKRYEIERNGKRGYNKLVPVTVNFSIFEDDGSKISLNGEDREGTNKAIREIVGSYEDFTMTSLSTQNDNQNFIDKSQKDRKELLYKFLDIDVFEELNKIAREFHRDIQSQIKYLEKKDLTTKLAHLMKDYQDLKKQAESAEEKVLDNQGATKIAEEDIETLKNKLIPLVDNINIEEVKNNLNKRESQFKTIAEEANLWKTKLKQLYSLQEEFSMYEALDHSKIKEDLKEYQKELQLQSNHIAQTTTEIQHLVGDIEESNHHQYDPNCKFCISSSVVVKGKEALLKLERAEKYLEGLEQYIKVLQKNIQFNRDSLESYDKCIKNIQEIHVYESKMTSLKVVAEHCRDEITQAYQMIERYEANQTNIASNKEIEDKIDTIENRKFNLNGRLKGLLGDWNDLTKSIGVLEHSIEETKDSLDELHGLNIKALAYSYYLQAVNRDGIPFSILNKVLPLLESEVNEILTQLVDFTIVLECDNSSISAYINYGPDRFWPVELASGMERFMLSLAIRSALVNITTLPRPNFLAIDEGFGVLDADKVSSIYMLFDYLKTQYTFLICISHLDVMRDLTDKHISIVKENGASKIVG